MTSITKLELHFSRRGEDTELVSTIFTSPLTQHGPVTSIRADSPLREYVAFKWTTAMHALSYFFVEAALKAQLFPGRTFILEGHAGMPASSIGFACSKSRLWLSTIFGVDKSGRSLLRRALFIGNARGWNPGPTRVALRESFLDPKNIKIWIDGRECNDIQSLTTIASDLLKRWKPGVPRQEQYLRTQLDIRELAKAA